MLLNYPNKDSKQMLLFNKGYYFFRFKHGSIFSLQAEFTCLVMQMVVYYQILMLISTYLH